SICVVCGEEFIANGQAMCAECRVEVPVGQRKLIVALRRIAAALETLSVPTAVTVAAPKPAPKPAPKVEKKE
ncbi:MAG: hypothetical protein WC565_09345, partial [Parcubacteria group bacterium]